MSAAAPERAAAGSRRAHQARRLRRALTRRGQVLLGAGVGCLIAAQIAGERDLLRVGVLLLALPLAALLIAGRTRYRIRLTRSVSPSRVEAGAAARVLLRLENASRLPSTVLLMEDTLPYALGGRPRFVLPQVEAAGVREATYAVRSDTRGRHVIGPLTVRMTDPFGCVELRRGFDSRETITVTPKIFALPDVSIGGGGRTGGEGSAAQAGVIGDADVATREYRFGDDLRKVHWRSTAKRGELMVRRDEQPRQNRATVLLDTRRLTHRGDGPDSSFEWAVSAAASITLWLTRRGYAVHLATSTGDAAGAATPALAESSVLDLLSVLEPGRESRLDGALRAIPAAPGLLLAVITTPDAADLHSLGRARLSAHRAIAVCLDAVSWSTAPTRGAVRTDPAPQVDTAHGALDATGWRVVAATRGDRIDQLWPQVGSRTAGQGAAALAPTEPAPAAAGWST